MVDLLETGKDSNRAPITPQKLYCRGENQFLTFLFAWTSCLFFFGLSHIYLFNFQLQKIKKNPLNLDKIQDCQLSILLKKYWLIYLEILMKNKSLIIIIISVCLRVSKVIYQIIGWSQTNDDKVELSRWNCRLFLIRPMHTRYNLISEIQHYTHYTYIIPIVHY